MDASNSRAQLALDASIQSSRVDQRAWVGIKNFDIEGPALSMGQIIRINMNLINTGKTPALDVGMSDCGSGDTQAYAEASTVGCESSAKDRSVIAPNAIGNSMN